MFYDILEGRNVFLDYENKKFKKLKNWDFSKGVSLWWFFIREIKEKGLSVFTPFLHFFKHNLFTLYKVISCGTELHGVNFLLSEFVLLRLEA